MSKRIGLFIFAMAMGVTSTAFAGLGYSCYRYCNLQYQSCVKVHGSDDGYCDNRAEACRDNCN